MPFRKRQQQAQQFSDAQLDALASALQNEAGRDFMELMRAWTIHKPPQPSWLRAAALGVEPGLVYDKSLRLTPLGEVAAHSFREYLYWEERGRDMPSVPEVQASAFAGQDVLEVGSGFGCNLLSLGKQARSVTGLEIQRVYVQLTSVLSSIAGEPAPTVVEGNASELPFDDQCFDTVLAIGSLQYTPIQRSIAQMHRVLRPGGRAVLILGHLSGFLVEHVVFDVKSPRRTLHSARDAFTTITYPWLGRALGPNDAPVHPTQQRMCAWLQEAGFAVDSARTFAHETVYVGTRPR